MLLTRMCRSVLINVDVVQNMLKANQLPISLLAKARTYMHLASDQMSEVSGCCDSNIALTRLLNAMRTEIVEDCIN